MSPMYSIYIFVSFFFVSNRHTTAGAAIRSSQQLYFARCRSANYLANLCLAFERIVDDIYYKNKPSILSALVLKTKHQNIGVEV